MRVNTNYMALNAWRNLNVSSLNLSKSLEKLSSGLRINRASDDAAGLTVSEKMRAQIRGLNMAIRNAQDGISMIQTAEGAAAQIQNMVQRMRELTVQAASESLSDLDRAQIDKEFQQLILEITETAKNTTFNGISLLNSANTGTAMFTTDATMPTAKIKVSVVDPTKVAVSDTYTLNKTGNQITITDGSGTVVGKIDHAAGQDHFSINGVTIDASNFDWSSADGTVGVVTATAYDPADKSVVNLQVGASSGERLQIVFENLTAAALGLTGLRIDSGDTAHFDNVIDTLDRALEIINGARANLGSYQNRLESKVSTLQVMTENLTQAESRIRDVDMAQEMSNFAKYPILTQAGTAMLAQANAVPQAILSLLR